MNVAQFCHDVRVHSFVLSKALFDVLVRKSVNNSSAAVHCISCNDVMENFVIASDGVKLFNKLLVQHAAVRIGCYGDSGTDYLCPGELLEMGATKTQRKDGH